MKFSTRGKKILLRAWLAVQKPFCEEVLVLGDSHAKVFGHPLMRLKLGRYHLNVVSVGGATASGLENPNSKTQAFQRFKQALATTHAKKVVVILARSIPDSSSGTAPTSPESPYRRLSRRR